MSTSVEFSAVVPSNLNLKDCSRTTCADPARKSKCCDCISSHFYQNSCIVLIIATDTCILEIARRDCNSGPAHKQPLDTSLSHEISRDISVPSRADEEPCESHYLK